VKVKYVGFGGTGLKYPVYKDNKNHLYFDMNGGSGALELYTGAYYRDDYIEGEPCSSVEGPVECDEPFVSNPYKFTYQMLGRLKSDCEYYLGYGQRYEGHLWAKSVSGQIEEMKRLWNTLPSDGKPKWLTMEQIDEYEKQMLNS